MSITKNDAVSEKDTDELERLNQTFADRYTDQDEEYIKMTENNNIPPTLPDWGRQTNVPSSSSSSNNNNYSRYSSYERQRYRNQHSNYDSQYRESSNYHHRHRYRSRSRSPHNDRRRR